MGAPKKRPRGRPRKKESKFSTWMDSQRLTRDAVAARLGIQRTYLDKLCRAESRPSLELAFEIEKLTRGSVPASDWLSVPAHTGD
jgi:transcriptional regulator with XRE-family HTH domain